MCLRTSCRPCTLLTYFLLFQSVERICVPSNAVAPAQSVAEYKVSIRRTDLCAFEPLPLAWSAQVAIGFNPSNGFVCLRTTYSRPSPTGRCSFNPSNGFVCLRTLERRKVAGVQYKVFQSVERICVPSNVMNLSPTASLIVFQSVERICVPSNPKSICCAARSVPRVSIRRTDLCAFERGSSGGTPPRR